MSINKEEIIRSEAEKIREKIKDSYLYGISINDKMNDIDFMMVAAYYLADIKALEERIENSKKRMEIFFSSIK